MLKLSLPIFFTLFFTLNITGQITVTPAESDANHELSIENLVQNVLLGQNIEIVAVNYSGNIQAAALVEQANNTIGFEQGLILSNGIATDIFPSEENGTNLGGESDTDLASLVDGPISDAAILEITFVPSQAFFKFDYVFASQDYGNFNCGNFTDPIGFFISGPALVGPFSNNAINLATVPSSNNIPVNVNSINNGIAGSPGNEITCLDLNPNWLQDTIYFAGNPEVLGFSGQTVVLPSQPIELVPFETYHLKIAIGDEIDGVFDSAIFLKGNSFSAFSNMPGIQDTLIIDTLICNQMSLELFDMTFDSTGQYEFVVEDVNGEDSLLVVLSLHVGSSLTIKESLYACEGEPITIGDSTFTTSGVYEEVFISQNGCDSIIQTPIFISETAFTNIDYPNTICHGTTLVLTYGTHFNSNLEVIPTTITSNDTLLIPDGTGEAISSVININQFAPGQVLESIDQLRSVCVNMEHSWLRDLEITLTCPDGTTVILHDYPGNFGGGVNLGEPIDQVSEVPGLGYDYCWTMDATNGTWLEYIDLTGVGTLPADHYRPFDSFENLLGCPLNGDWTISITDSWGQDNGFLFSWSLDIGASAVNTPTDTTNVIIDQGWQDGEGVIFSNNLTLEAEPSVGTHTYTYFIQDAFGCTTEQDFVVTVEPSDTTLIEIELCEGATFDGQVFFESTTYIENLDTDGNCDSLYIYQITVYEESITSITETVCNADEAGVYELVLLSQHGCDSLLIITAIYEPADTIVTSAMTCVQADAGTTTTTTTNGEGCDVVNINILTFAWPYQVETIADTCSAGLGTATIVFDDINDSYQYVWGTGNPADTTASVSGLVAGVYSVTVTSELGCSAGILVEVENVIEGMPTADFVYASNFLTVDFTDQSEDAVTYLWDFGDGNTSTEQNPSHTFAVAGVHVVCLTVTNACDVPHTTCETIFTFGENTPSISGNIQTTPNHSSPNEGIEEVNVQLFSVQSAQTDLTNSAGDYLFAGLVQVLDYAIEPYKNEHDTEGLSTLGVILTLQHSFNETVLSNPYAILSADVDCNDMIEAVDAFTISDILINDASIENCEAWKFVPTDVQFENPNQPFDYPNRILLENLIDNANFNDFYGIKSGDVAREMGQMRPLDGDTLTLVAENRSYNEGETFTIYFNAHNFNNLLGYQIGINFNEIALSFEGVELGDLEGLSGANFGTQDTDMGEIKANWFHPNATPSSYADGTQMFGLHFTAKQDIETLSNHLIFNSDILNAEAYDGDNQTWTVALSWDGISSTTEAATLGYHLYQNQPNPFANSTQIAFELPTAMPAALTIYNALGQVIQVFDGRFSAGRNVIDWDSFDQLESGLFYYTLTTENIQLSRKMIFKK